MAFARPGCVVVSEPISSVRGIAGCPCILLAEDDPHLRALLAGELRREGYDVVEASDGSELVKHVVRCMSGGDGKRHPDLIITDVLMPGLTGLEVASGLRRAGYLVPIIFMTGFGDDETACAEAWDLGAAAVLDKPFDMADLRTAIWHALPSRPSQPAHPSAGLIRESKQSTDHGGRPV